MTAILAALALQGAAPVSIGKAEYPPYVQKQLYAKTDLRGKKAPKFVWGEIVSGKVPEIKGKVVLIDFWATWCGPCRAVMPELDAMSKAFAKDLVVVGISDEKRETLTGYLQKSPVSYTITSDPGSSMSKVIGIQGIPQVMVVSPDGLVRWQGFPGDGKDPLTKEKVAVIIAASKAR